MQRWCSAMEKKRYYYKNESFPRDIRKNIITSIMSLSSFAGNLCSGSCKSELDLREKIEIINEICFMFYSDDGIH